MKLLILIFVGQFVFAVLRTAAVRAIAADRRAAAISLNAGASLMRLLVLTGGVSAVLESDWRAVVVFVAAQAAGDYVSLRYGGKAAL